MSDKSFLCKLTDNLNLSAPGAVSLAKPFALSYKSEFTDEGLRVSSFNKNPERVLRNLYRTEHWLDDEKKDDSYNIIKSGDLDYNVGKLAMSDEELKVFVDVFSRGGFEAPCNWYRNISRNWRLMEGVPQTIEVNTLMIYGKYDMVPKVDMSESVKNLDIVTLDCGHWIQQEKPRETNEALSKWLNVQKVNYGFI